MSVAEFVQFASANLWTEPARIEGFHEAETEQKVELFGRVAQIFSKYECRTDADPLPFVAGVNSFQLIQEDESWKIISLTWDRLKKA